MNSTAFKEIVTRSYKNTKLIGKNRNMCECIQVHVWVTTHTRKIFQNKNPKMKAKQEIKSI